MQMNIVKKEIETAIREAGRIVLEAERPQESVEEKSGPANFVTKYDKQVQKFLEKRLLEILPEAVFVGEEEDVHASIQKGYSFIVDPIDGTTNFMKGYHMSAISIALLLDARPILGMIYNPYLDELFAAERGKGAVCNETPIHVSGNALKDGIVIFGTAPYYPELIDATFSYMRRYFDQALDLRRSGSAALDLCSIACGRAELFFELRLSPWDYAAGALIIEEAGGTVTGMDDEALQFAEPMGILAKGCR